MKKIICLLMAIALCIATGAGIAEPAAETDIFGAQDGSRYENETIGVGCVFDGWTYYSKDQILATYNLAKDASSEQVAAILEANQSIIVMFAEAPDQLQSTNLVLDSAAVPYLKAYGEKTYFEEMIKLYDQVAPAQGWNDFNSEIVQKQIGGKTVSGLKNSYIYNGIQIYQVQLAWLDGDYVGIITATSYLTDNCDSIIEHFYMLNE